MKNFSTLFTLLLVLGTAALSAQDGRIAIDYLQQKFPDLGLQAEDVRDLEVTDDYTSGGIRHIYVNQRYAGIPVYNAQAILHYRGTSLLLATTSRLAPDLATSGLITAPALPAQTAVTKAISEISATFGSAIATGTEGNVQLFSLPGVSDKPIRARLVFFPTDHDGIRLAWDVTIDQHAARSDYWTIMVDAQNGDVLAQHNHVLKCNFGSRPHQHNYADACAQVEAMPTTLEVLGVDDGSQYNVFPFGVESPIHGDRVLIKNPADEVASPFGWHDTNGEEGPEFTITRGNNVYAYPDTDGDDNPDAGVVADGGDSLNFDFFYADEQQPDSIVEAALAQVFYTSSAIHDWLHYAGFDEASGNFQRENYTGDGEDRDEVLAEAQDGSGTNNANFFTPTDGNSGVMQMFLWENGAASIMEATFPASVAGPVITGAADFGAVIGNEPTTGQVVYSDPALGCDPLNNDLTGKIALITRGTCEFGTKVLNAENAGAIGAIICNDAPLNSPDGRGGTIGMAPGTDGGSVTIPSVFVSLENCAPLRVALDGGDSLSVTFQSTAPPDIDGDFDNGIVAHEIGHGVSNRLVGGPNNTSCLFTDEQMGEGWSDFYALASTPRTITDTPDGTEPRGIGNYATNRGINGAGIRRKPYSTDMGVNNFTYDAIITSGVPHPLGEIWATTLWDLYWTLSEEYGFDDDLITGTGGNNLAVQLVTEGLKYTDCGPGLIDGRNGILAADEILYNGANQCLIWEVFARRGMGFSATAGSPNDRTDGREAFDLSPYCIGGIQAEKRVSAATVEAGENVVITIEVTNYDSTTATGVTVTEEIPAGLEIDEATVVGADFTISGNTIVFTLDDLDFDDNQTIRYTASTDAELGSTPSFFDGAEDGDDNWEFLDLSDGETGVFFWEQADSLTFEGDLAYYIVNTGAAEDQALQTFEPLPVVGDKPGLRFFTRYDTEVGWDGGIVEVSTDGTNWDKVDDKFFRGGYRGTIDENGSAQLLDIGSYWGDNEEFTEQIIDLSEFAGQDLYFRFRFVSDAEVSGRAWAVDNIEIIDIINYDGEVTVSSNEHPDFTTRAGELGVLAVGGDMTDNTNDPELGQTEVSVYPNPTDAEVNITVTAERAGTATVQIMTTDGRTVYNEALRLLPGGTTTTVNTAALPAGLYLVQVTGASRVSTTKLTVN